MKFKLIFKHFQTENSEVLIPVPRPRSISSKKSSCTNGSSGESISATSASNKSSLQNSRSVTPESVSIELSESSEITDSSNKIIPLKYSIQ